MMSNALLTRQNKEIFIFLSIYLNLFVDATQLIHYAKSHTLLRFGDKNALLD